MSELKKNNRPVYDYILNRGLQKKYFPEHPERISWDYELLEFIVSHLRTRKEFEEVCPKGYWVAYYRGCMDRLFKSHKDNGYQPNSWRYRCVYFLLNHKEKTFYVGITNNYKRRIKAHKLKYSHHEPEPKNFEGEVDKIVWEGVDYIHYKKALKLESEYISKGYLDYECLNRSLGGQLGSMKRKWNLESISKEAEDCEYRYQLRQKNAAAYQAAYDLGLLDEVFKDCPNRGRKPRREYSY